MHELQRRAYLDAMGIPTFIARSQLPGAAPAVKLVRKREGVSSSKAETAPVRAPAIPDIALAAKPKTPKTEPRAAAEPTSRVEFSIAVVQTGDVLWLEALTQGQVLLREQVQLFQSMALAAGWGKHRPAVSQFTWPIHNNTQLDLGEEAAQAALGGFVSGKMEREGVATLVVMGPACQRWLSTIQDAKPPLILSISTTEMLRQPALKKQAWRELLPHSR